jgi:hypothetical protein
LLHGPHQDLVDLDLDARTLEHLAHDLERRLQAPANSQAARAPGQIEKEELDPQLPRGLRGAGTARGPDSSHLYPF